ncbi:hypothetical protein CEXT_538221 [Caerostris extrusa]|uniref:Uncharacterized protein n=1 Tax=Caerostris extrusa TaxID=172846 RepID=A0AAV4RGM8_CAEEX|nr:hypothetical protein CEXT_538221 [Caerostris extrusa]
MKVLTQIREVVDQDDLVDEFGRRAIEHAVHRSEEHAPGFVVEADDHAGGGKVLLVLLLATPAEKKEHMINVSSLGTM